MTENLCADYRHYRDKLPKLSGYEEIENTTFHHAQGQAYGRPHKLPLRFVGVVPRDSIFAEHGKMNHNCVDDEYTNNLKIMELAGSLCIVWAVIEPER